MTLIQAFWLVAFAVADRIAISPLLSICLAIDSTWFCADQLGRDLVDEHAAGIRGHVRVHADDLHAALRGLLQRGRNRVRVVAGDDDRVRLLLHRGVDDRDLGRCAGVRGTVDPVRAAQLLERLVDTRVLELLVGVAELLRDRDRLDALLDRGVGIGGCPPATAADASRPSRRWSRRRRRRRARPPGRAR